MQAEGAMMESEMQDGGQLRSRNRDGGEDPDSRRKHLTHNLPEGPIDEDVQEELLAEFKAQQQSQELCFSSILVVVALPLVAFFLIHSYWHLLSPWSGPFQGLEGADPLGRKLGSFAHVCSGLSILGSFVSTMAHRRLRTIRKHLLLFAVLQALVAGALWFRIFISLAAFPWEYVVVISILLVGPLLLQWFVFSTWEATQGEIRNLENLKYRCHTA